MSFSQSGSEILHQCYSLQLRNIVYRFTVTNKKNLHVNPLYVRVRILAMLLHNIVQCLGAHGVHVGKLGVRQAKIVKRQQSLWYRGEMLVDYISEPFGEPLVCRHHT